MKRTLWLLAVLLAVPFGVHAQSNSGRISGAIHDPSGALVPGATVALTNTDRNQVVRTVITDAQGFYAAPQLPLGHYKITVTAKGFKQQEIQDITLHIDDALTFNATLLVGSTSQSVTVNAAALQVDTESAMDATLINSKQIVQLPLNDRNYEQLVQLQPGVAYGGGDQLYIGLSNPFGETNVVSFSINGQRNSANNWTVDGADNVDRGSNLTLLIYPSVDAIAEFKTLRNTYSAAFGRSASGQIDVITKSGTHDFHGNAYEFFRNNVLDANYFFNNYSHSPRPPLRYNDFGYTVGGPLFIPHVYNSQRNKTFFFFSQEVRRVITYSPLVLTGDPTTAERAGTFPDQVCTNASCTASGNQVTNFDPTAQAYLKDVWSNVPLPNSPTDPNGLIVTERNLFNANQQIVRLDHNLSSKFAVFFRFENDAIPTQEPGGLFSGAGFPGVGVTSTNAPGRNYLVHVNYIFNPTLLLDGGYAKSDGAIISAPIGLMNRANSPDVRPTLPYVSTLDRIPSVSIQGGTGLTSFGPYNEYNRDQNVFMNLSKVAGQHTLRFGFTYHYYQKTENAGGGNAGSFSFIGNTRPAGSKASVWEQAYANFLIGNVTTFSQASLDITPDIRANQAEGYAQDDWKATSRLALNLGVRYSWFQQPIDDHHMLSNFDPNAFVPGDAPAIDSNGNICSTAPCAGGATPNPNANPLNGIILANVTSPFGSHVAPQAWLDFAPRVGFAYDVRGDGKTVVRGGYGIAYDSSLFGTYEQNIFANPPYVQSINIPNTNMNNPGAGTASISALPKTLHATPYIQNLPYSQQFSLGVQQELAPSLIAEMDYVGDLGTHLIGSIDLNESLPGQYVTAGIAPPGGITYGNTPKLNQIRPYKGYGPINAIEPWFTSNYNSLQTSIQKRFHDGSMIDANYTWSKGLTNNQSDRSTAVQDTYNINAEYGRSQLDRRNMFTLDYVYQLPFFQNSQGMTKRFLGGWQLAGLVLANSGLPYTATTSQDPAGLGFLGPSAAGARPNQVGDPNTNAPHTLKKWFNTAAFANVPKTVLQPGNEHRGVINGPGFQRWDLAMYKVFAINDTTGFQFRAESFNTFNHTNYDTIYTYLPYAAAFGTVTGTRDPRIMQLAMKFYF
jgi:hypothetical protein